MIAHVVLAAGAGTRVGKPKALIDLRGRSILERILTAGRTAGVDHLVAVFGAKKDEIRAHALGASTEFVRGKSDTMLHLCDNDDWPTGQTSSLLVGLRAMPRTVEAFMIHPIDHCLVRDDHLVALMNAWKADPSPDRIFRPFHDGEWGHPVLFAARYLKDFLSLDANTPAYRVYRANLPHVRPVEMPDDDCSFDLDTPDDLIAARARARP